MKKNLIAVCAFFLMSCGHPYQPETVTAARAAGSGDLAQMDQKVRAERLTFGAGKDSGYFPCLERNTDAAIAFLKREGETIDDIAVTYSVAYAEGQCEAERDRFLTEFNSRAPGLYYDGTITGEQADQMIRAAWVKSYLETGRPPAPKYIEP